jgi:hypothetical protein
MSAEQLKPCPFCGETPFWPEGTPGVWRRHCRAFCRTANCRGNTAGQSFPTEDEAIADWNKRVDDPIIAQQAAELAALKADNEIFRDAIGHAMKLVEDFANSPDGDNDMSQGAARATRRRLNEALGKMMPRLMMERELSPKYGLRWKELGAELAALRLKCEGLEAAERRYAKLRDNFMGADFEWGRDDDCGVPGTQVLLISWDGGPVYGCLDTTLDKADAASSGAKEG